MVVVAVLLEQAGRQLGVSPRLELLVELLTGGRRTKHHLGY